MPGVIDYTVRRFSDPRSHHPGNGLHLDPVARRGRCLLLCLCLRA